MPFANRPTAPPSIPISLTLNKLRPPCFGNYFAFRNSPAPSTTKKISQHSFVNLQTCSLG